MSNKSHYSHASVKFFAAIALVLTVAGILLAIGGQLDFLGNERRQVTQSVAVAPATKKTNKPKYSFYDELKKRKTELEQSGKVVTSTHHVASSRPTNDKRQYVVQVGAFSKKNDANRMKTTIEKLGYPGRVVKSSSNKYLTQAGPFAGKVKAQSVEKRLRLQRMDTLLKRLR